MSESPETRRSGMSGGFTLVELVALLVIVGIMAGVAIPSLSTLGSTRSSMAGRQIVRDLAFASTPLIPPAAAASRTSRLIRASAPPPPVRWPVGPSSSRID